MPDDTNTAPTEESKVEETPKLIDSVRDAIREEDDPAPATAEGGEGGEGGEGDASTPTTEEVKEALTEALPELTEAQIAQLAEDPRLVTAVLGGQQGAAVLDELFKEVISTHETQTETRRVQAEVTKTAEEALKLGQEEGDWGPFGQFMAERLAEVKAVKTTTEAEVKARAKAMGSVLGDLDAAVEQVYGDVLDTLTEDELASLGRGNFKTDAEFMAGVLGLLATKHADMVRSEAGNEAVTKLTEDASATADAARKARELVGAGALPGGSGVESPGESVGSLLRQGLKDAFADVEE